MKTNKLIIIDLEATCWDDKPRDFVAKNQEIIEIGITVLSPKEKAILSNETFLIKPSTKLSEFCTNLTTITDDMLNDKPSLKETLSEIDKKYNLRNYVWGSWGYYDLNQLKRETKRKNIKNPFFDKNHINLKTKVALDNGWSKGVGIEKALKILNLSFDGTPHRAIDDTKNIAKILIT